MINNNFRIVVNTKIPSQNPFSNVFIRRKIVRRNRITPAGEYKLRTCPEGFNYEVLTDTGLNCVSNFESVSIFLLNLVPYQFSNAGEDDFEKNRVSPDEYT